MTKKQTGLGRGLDALLDDFDLDTPSTGATEVSLYDIDTNPDQPRKSFDPEKLKELAASLQRHGVVQPLLVRKNGLRYTIVAGERRFRAAKLAGLKTVPVVCTSADADTLMELSLVENIQRENLNPIEEAAALKLLMQQHDLTQEEVSARVGKSRPAIANALRLLSLTKPVQQLVKDGKLSPGHGKMLAGVTDKKLQESLALACAENDWSVRRLEDEVRFASMRKSPQKSKQESPELKAALHRMRMQLGTKITMQGGEDKGRLIIHYYSKEDLERIYQAIVGTKE